uniref:Uncharacterized protein n=1 Tax=Onchocerca volvulus TaxID=6282 RepID=A0A8R1Y307_ONCVO
MQQQRQQTAIPQYTQFGMSQSPHTVLVPLSSAEALQYRQSQVYVQSLINRFRTQSEIFITLLDMRIINRQYIYCIAIVVDFSESVMSNVDQQQNTTSESRRVDLSYVESSWIE